MLIATDFSIKYEAPLFHISFEIHVYSQKCSVEIYSP